MFNTIMVSTLSPAYREPGLYLDEQGEDYMHFTAITEFNNQTPDEDVKNEAFYLADELLDLDENDVYIKVYRMEPVNY